MVSIPKSEYHKLLEAAARVAWFERQMFGRKSERFIPELGNDGQLSLEGFEEEKKDEQQEETVKTEDITYTRQKTNKKGNAVRLEIPPHLPRHEIIIEPDHIPEGALKIGEEVTEVLNYSPGKMHVDRYIRPKYALPEGQGVTIGNLPSFPIPKGNAGPGLLAHIFTSKFVDHLPFYRQSQIFLRQDNIVIPKSTMSSWFMKGSETLPPLYNCMIDTLLQSNYMQADESPLAVLESDKKGATHRGYHWVYHDPLGRIVIFDYQKSRSRAGPRNFLKDFNGVIQTDGYEAYINLFPDRDIARLACMAHARRKFHDAQGMDSQRANHALKLFNKLYAIEREAREKELTYEERKALRLEKALSVLKELEKWLRDELSTVLPKSVIGKAISYSLRLWPRLIHYLEDGRYEIDNNLIENKIRPFALGRKNYLFAGSHQAAQNAAMMYSFFATCKLHDVDPFEWLRDVLEKIQDTKITQLESMLPWNYKSGLPA